MNSNFISLSNRVVVSDPGYEIPTWCQIVLTDVLPGRYKVGFDTIQEYGERFTALFAVHEKYAAQRLRYNRYGMTFGVDSGQAGIFSLDSYRNDGHTFDAPAVTYDGTVFNYTKETDGDAWYERCSRMTLSKEGWGSYDQGVVSRSGFGDGEHICWTARKEKHVVGIILDFNMIKYNNELLNLLVWDN